MENDFVDVFPSAGGVGDSPVKGLPGSSSSRPALSLSIPTGLESGGREALVSPAVTEGLGKESLLRSARGVSEASDAGVAREDDVVMLDTPSESPNPARVGLMPLTIEAGVGECVPTELEKKRAKLEKYRYECSEVSEALLFVSGEDAAKQQGLVGSKGITHIINCAGPQCPNYLEYTGRFKFLRLNFYDHRTEDCAWFIYSAFDFIKAAEEQRGRVLVHCVQGVSRSCTLAIAWLMLTKGIDYDEAYTRVREGRPICAPNTSFICSLLEWQRRRQKPLSSPLMYRTAWHVPLFPNDLVLKICLHEDDRTNVHPTKEALDSRGCYLLVFPREGKAPAPAPVGAGVGFTRCLPSSAPSSKKQQRTGGFTVPTPPLQAPNANGSGRRSGSFESALPPASAASASRPSALPPASTRCLNGRLSTPSPAAARARAAAAAAVIANAKAVAAVAAAKEAQAVAAAAAAEEAVMVAKAVEAGVAVPWTWRESEVSRGIPKDRRSTAAAKASPLQVAAAANGRLLPEAAARRASASEGLMPVAGGAGDDKEEAWVDVYVWKGARSTAQMLELAKKGARWLRDYEGWGAGTGAPMVEDGQEPPEVLRHLEQTDADARESPVYGDLTSPSPPPTAARTGQSSFMPCPTPSLRGGGGGNGGHGGGGMSAPMLSPADTPTLSPAGPSPSPGGVSFSPYGCGVSPAGGVNFGSSQGGGPTISPSGSTAVSPATGPGRPKLSTGSGYGGYGGGYGGYNPPRCSMASATEEMDEDTEEDENEERLAMGLSPLGEGRPSSMGIVGGGGGAAGLVGRGGGRDANVPRLFELSDELGGQGVSGLRWSQLTIFDDQDLLPQCCFLLVSPGEQSFLWVGKSFATGPLQHVSTPQQLQALARDVAVRDTRRQSDRLLPRVSDVETAVFVPGDGNEPPEWWSAFERGYT
eukprot:g6373.t1